jgi:hypothetical protein
MATRAVVGGGASDGGVVRSHQGGQLDSVALRLVGELVDVLQRRHGALILQAQPGEWLVNLTVGGERHLELVPELRGGVEACARWLRAREAGQAPRESSCGSPPARRPPTARA